MANLDEMREFLGHWEAYRAQTERLEHLLRDVPVDVDALDETARAGFPTDEPEHPLYQIDIVRRAIDAAAASRPAREPEPVWGWWFVDADWRAWEGIAALRGDLEEKRLKLRAIEAQRRAAIEDDDARRKALDAVDAYTKANDEDTRSVAELEAKVASASEDAVATEDGIIRRFIRRIRARAQHRRAAEHLERLRGEVEARTSRRAKEIERLTAEATDRERELAEPFDGPREESARAVEEAERRLIDALARDIAARDPGFAADELAERPFEDALAAACAREWDLLAAWMRRYARELPSAIEHARFIADSELVWLEGHDPFGKRYWPLAGAVVDAMEAGEARDSDAALAAVRTAEPR